MKDGDLAFGENGERIPVANFPFHLLDEVAAEEKGIAAEEFTIAELAGAEEAFRRLMTWVWQDGMRNPEGVKIRAIICCWVFLKHVRPCTLTELAARYGMKKQSLGRWVDQFKLDFPDYWTCHMRQIHEPTGKKKS